VLPPAARAAAESLAVYAPAVRSDDGERERLRLLREATEARRVVQLDYESLQGAASQRRVRPLGVFYWDHVWTLASWCELRRDFRNFRVDHIRGLNDTGESFRDEPGKTLADLLRLVRAA
jgi:predicted DNA-binding transcriptional regulator YafY